MLWTTRPGLRTSVCGIIGSWSGSVYSAMSRSRWTTRPGSARNGHWAPTEARNAWIAGRSGGADEHLLGARWRQRGGPAGRVAGEYGGHAGVADAAAARPLRGYVGGLGQLEARGRVLGPRRGEPGPRERDLRARSWG